VGFELIYTQTITLFNRHIDNRKPPKSIYGIDEDNIIWVPTVIRDVHLVMNRAKIISMYGENCTDNVLLHIMYERNGADAVIAGKTYMKPKIYAETSVDGYGFEEYITFAMGDNFDFFMEGEWEELGNTNVIISDSDYEPGFYNYMNHKYDNVFAITGCTKYSLIPHFEITGR